MAALDTDHRAIARAICEDDEVFPDLRGVAAFVDGAVAERLRDPRADQRVLDDVREVVGVEALGRALAAMKGAELRSLALSCRPSAKFSQRTALARIRSILLEEAPAPSAAPPRRKIEDAMDMALSGKVVGARRRTKPATP